MLRELLRPHHHGGEVLPSPGTTLLMTKRTSKDTSALVHFSYGKTTTSLLPGVVNYKILEAAGKAGLCYSRLRSPPRRLPHGKDPARSVVNQFCQSHDIPNPLSAMPACLDLWGMQPYGDCDGHCRPTADHIASQKWGNSSRNGGSVGPSLAMGWRTTVLSFSGAVFRGSLR